MSKNKAQKFTEKVQELAIEIGIKHFVVGAACSQGEYLNMGGNASNILGLIALLDIEIKDNILNELRGIKGKENK